LITAVSEQISSGSYPELLNGSAKPKSGRQRKQKQYREKSELPTEEQEVVAEEDVVEPKPENTQPEVVEETTEPVEETPAVEITVAQPEDITKEVIGQTEVEV
jgi:hypothetical protein